MSYLDNTGLAYFWSKLKALFATKQDTLVSGTNIKTVNNQSLLGTGNITAGIDDVTSPQDGTILITLSNGDVVTVDLNHVHSIYPKYEHLASESSMPATPDADTMYLIDGGGGGGASIVYLTDESQMPASPDANTLYVILESQS